MLCLHAAACDGICIASKNTCLPKDPESGPCSKVLAENATFLMTTLWGIVHNHFRATSLHNPSTYDIFRSYHHTITSHLITDFSGRPETQPVADASGGKIHKIEIRRPAAERRQANPGPGLPIAHPSAIPAHRSHHMLSAVHNFMVASIDLTSYP